MGLFWRRCLFFYWIFEVTQKTGFKFMPKNNPIVQRDSTPTQSHAQLKLKMANREEKSLRHVAIVAKFLDDNKLIKSLKVYSHYFKPYRSYSISFNLANLGEIFFGTVSIII